MIEGLASSITRVTGTETFLSKGSRPGHSGVVVCVVVSDSTEVRVGLKHHCKVSALRHKLVGLLSVNEQADGALPVSSESFVLVFRGRALRDSDTVPDACFKETHRDDPEWEPHEIWLSWYTKAPDEKDNAQEVRRQSHKEDAAIDESDLSNSTETVSQSKETVSTSRRPKLKSVTLDFDLQAELDRIGCGDAGEQLIAEGYGDRGAFSLINDQVLSNYPFYFAKSTRRHIVGLAEYYRELEERRRAEPSSVLEEMASPVKSVLSAMQQAFDDTKRVLDKLEDIDEGAVSLEGEALVSTPSNGDKEIGCRVNSAQKGARPDSSARSEWPGLICDGQQPPSWPGATINLGRAVPPDVSVSGVSLQAHLNALLRPVVWHSLMGDVATDEATIVHYLERLVREAFNGNDEVRHSQLLSMCRANDAVTTIMVEKLGKSEPSGTRKEQKVPLSQQSRILKATLITRLSQQLYSNAAAQRPQGCSRKGFVDAQQKLTNEPGATNPSCIFKQATISKEAQRLMDNIATRPDCNLDDFDLPNEHKPVLTKTLSCCCDSHAWSVCARLSNFAQVHRETARKATWTFLAGADASEPTRAELYMHVSTLLSTLGLGECTEPKCPRVEMHSALDSKCIERLLTVTQFNFDQSIGAALSDKAAFVEAVALAVAETALCHIDLRKRTEIFAIMRAQDSVHPEGKPCMKYKSDSYCSWQVQQLAHEHMRTVELYVGFRNAGYLNDGSNSMDMA